jgi:hypothetical protein
MPVRPSGGARAAARLLLACCAVSPSFVHAQSPTEAAQIRGEIDALRRDFDARLQALEQRLQQAVSGSPAPVPGPAVPAAPPEPAAAAAAPPSNANATNPALSLILSGGYNNLTRDPAATRITGFIASGAGGTGPRGFSLAESEVGIYANVDPYFYGGLNLALAPDDTVGVEEAFVQTTGRGMPGGLTLKAGRFFSGIGYLNEQHAHTWDFIDNPLAYEAFLGTQFGDDGLQLRYLLPIETWVELGAEIGRGRSFPAADRDANRSGAQALFAHVGGDWGVESSWRAGLSTLRANPRDRGFDGVDPSGAPFSGAFTGSSRLWIADAVWKWAPGGNPQRRNLKLAIELFRRSESGTLATDTAGSGLQDAYASRQRGGYVQGLFQFAPGWRTGLRYDRLSAGTVSAGLNDPLVGTTGYAPQRTSLVLEMDTSEFARLRLQLANDRRELGSTDRQIRLQYQMSLGAHGAHGY